MAHEGALAFTPGIYSIPGFDKHDKRFRNVRDEISFFFLTAFLASGWGWSHV